MTEATDQTQTPAVSESLAEEIPAQLAATETTESQTPELEPLAQDETALTAQITELWRLHINYAASMRSQTQNLRSLRAELGKRLSEMKQILARPGRGGEWSGWLRERRIPRATADRLVTKYERSLNPDENRLTESISEPTEEEIQTLLDRMLPKLRKALPTKTSVYKFIELLASLSVLERWETEEGFFLVKPSAHIAIEQSVSEKTQVEPVPVVAEVAVGAHAESAGTSRAR
jgi:hypothetical protein